LSQSQFLGILQVLDLGKPLERAGRKATDLPEPSPTIAGLPSDILQNQLYPCGVPAPLAVLEEEL
jgi:hypothetical protein